jgi:two-component sensor histidine kinase/streptogramin lyase
MLGVIKVTGSVFTSFKYENGIGSDKILSLCEDKHGNLWFGTGGAGAMRYSGGIFTYYKDVVGLGNGNIFSIAEGNDKTIWIGTSTDGAYRYSTSNGTDKPTPQNFSTASGLAGNNVRAILNDGKYIWMGTDNGLSRFNGNSFTTFNSRNGLKSNEIRSLLNDSKGNLWIGTYGQGVAKYDGNTFTHYGPADGMSHGYVHSILEDSKGNLWFGTGNGVNKFDGEEFTVYGPKNGFCNSYIGSMAEDKVGNLWFGTDRCVVKYDGKKFTQITENDGLLSNTIYLLQLDNDGHLWVGSNKGVDKLVLDDHGNIAEIISYGKEKGFRGVECNTRAVCKDNEGNLWFGTIGGAIKYNPSEDVIDSIPPSAHITGVKLFFEDVDLRPYGKSSQSWFKLPNSLELPHDMNHLTFQFLGIAFGNADNIGYSFKLEGFDINWLPITSKREATYSNIPPGTYTFMVKVVNSDGFWNKDPAKFTFTIEVPFWRSWWFYLCMAILFLVIFYFFTTYRTKKLNKTKSILEQEVSKRIQEITKEKEEKELLIKEVHHRVKNNLQIINSLLSIQSSYIKDEKVMEMFSKSIDRIKSMAIIHEKLYKSKDLTHIDIQDYLTVLAHGLINSYNLDKHIVTDIEILVKQLTIDTLIPVGLIINELLTNSIKHAFEDQPVGKIFIFMDVTDDRKYKLVVGDDGKGISKKKSEKPKETLGMELIKILVEQIDGTIERKKQKGTVYKILFRGIGKDKIIN